MNRLHTTLTASALLVLAGGLYCASPSAGVAPEPPTPTKQVPKQAVEPQRTRGLDISDIDKAAKQVCSPRSSDRAEGNAWIQDNGELAIAKLVWLIEHGPADEQASAAQAATRFISTWQRAVVQGNTHKGQIELYLVQRPVDRPADHAHAALLRQAGLAALDAALASGPEPRPEDGEHAEAIASLRLAQQIEPLCTLIAEVADPDTADHLAELLGQDPPRPIAAALMAVLDTYHGLPTTYMQGGWCGTVTREEARRIKQIEDERCRDAADKLLAWHKKHADKPLDQRINAALDAWDEQLKDENAHAYFNTGNWTTQHVYTNLVRMGKPAVKHMRKRIELAPDDAPFQRGAYDIAIAAITGEVDAAFVRRLLGGETFDIYLGCEIVAAAASKDFKDELSGIITGSVHRRDGGRSMKASHTLACIYRAQAIPILRRAHSSDYNAEYAIKELEAWGE